MRAAGAADDNRSVPTWIVWLFRAALPIGVAWLIVSVIYFVLYPPNQPIYVIQAVLAVLTAVYLIWLGWQWRSGSRSSLAAEGGAPAQQRQARRKRPLSALVRQTEREIELRAGRVSPVKEHLTVYVGVLARATRDGQDRVAAIVIERTLHRDVATRQQVRPAAFPGLAGVGTRTAALVAADFDWCWRR